MKSKSRSSFEHLDADYNSLKTTIHHLQLTFQQIENRRRREREAEYVLSPYKNKRRRFKFSPSNRMKFQTRLRMSKQGSSPNLLSQETKRFNCPYPACNKQYKLEGALKTHVKNIHGGTDEDSLCLSETKFDPQEASTAGMTDEARETRKRKRSSVNQRPEITDSDETDTEENLEEAVRAKENRRKTVAQLNIERDLEMGYDVEDSMIGPVNTQKLLTDLTEAVETAVRHVASPTPASPKYEVGIEEETIADMSGFDNNNGALLQEKEERIKTLEKMIECKDSTIEDLKIVQMEMNDQLDEKDRVIKEKRRVVKLKQEEIDDLLKDKQENLTKWKKSPLKENLKQEAAKAQRQISIQMIRIRNLEAQNDELTRQMKRVEKEKPDISKLKKTASDCLDRAQHFDREMNSKDNKIAQLKKKIPCSNMAKCDLGKKCAYSHALKYVNDRGEREKKIPCIHFINNRCKYGDEECNFSHNELYMTGKQRRAFIDARRNLDSIKEESPNHSRYSRSANRYTPKQSGSKRMKVNEEYMEYDDVSDATDNYPTPTPAGSSRRSSISSRGSSRGSSKAGMRPSGNANGARGRRSTPESPRSRRGSRQSRGRRSMTPSPPPNRKFVPREAAGGRNQRRR